MTWQAWCNPYGWENPDGPNAAGGLLANPIDEGGIFRCGNRADQHFRAVCQHGHVQGRGDNASSTGGSRAGAFGLCRACYLRLTGQVAGWTGATPYKPGFLSVCPRCQVTIGDHRCQLRLEAVS